MADCMEGWYVAPVEFPATIWLCERLRLWQILLLHAVASREQLIWWSLCCVSITQFIEPHWFLWPSFPQTPGSLCGCRQIQGTGLEPKIWFQKDNEGVSHANTDPTWKSFCCLKFQLLRLAFKKLHSPISKHSLRYTWNSFLQAQALSAISALLCICSLNCLILTSLLTPIHPSSARSSVTCFLKTSLGS